MRLSTAATPGADQATRWARVVTARLVRTVDEAAVVLDRLHEVPAGALEALEPVRIAAEHRRRLGEGARAIHRPLAPDHVFVLGIEVVVFFRGLNEVVHRTSALITCRRGDRTTLARSLPG